MEIRTYSLEALEEYSRTAEYTGAKHIPISPERIRSYQANPRALPGDKVLFTLHKEGELVAYRTVLSDHFYSGETRHRFGWLSGNYVAPEHRRSGYSTRLFTEVEKAWDGALMYTNYAPESKAVYDKTGSFDLLKEHPGRRYYMRSSLDTLLQKRLNAPTLLRAADRLLNRLHDPSIGRYSVPEMPGEVQVTPIEAGSTELAISDGIACGQGLFRRDREEFQWIMNHPWITPSPEVMKKASYGFKRKVDHHIQYLCNLSCGASDALLWIRIVDDQMSVPYYCLKAEEPALHIAARSLILEKMVHHRANNLTLHHPALAGLMGLKPHPFLFSKSITQRYFAHRSLKEIVPESFTTQDGDGDVVFT